MPQWHVVGEKTLEVDVSQPPIPPIPPTEETNYALLIGAAIIGALLLSKRRG